MRMKKTLFFKHLMWKHYINKTKKLLTIIEDYKNRKVYRP